jgi:hypothetical protein
LANGAGLMGSAKRAAAFAALVGPAAGRMRDAQRLVGGGFRGGNAPAILLRALKKKYVLGEAEQT